MRYGASKKSDRNQAVIAKYRLGETMDEIGLQFGISKERVRQIIVKYGKDERSRRAEVRKEKARALFLEGCTLNEVYQKTGLSVTKLSFTDEDKKANKEARFWQLVDKRGPDDCWEWQGCKYPTGYGRSNRIDGKSEYAHRMAWQLANNRTTNLLILHSCDNPPCCNPNHLREGTPLENMRDRDIRNRSGWQRDYEGMRRKVVEGRKYLFVTERPDCKDAVQRYFGGETVVKLAKEFNVHPWTIYRWAKQLKQAGLFNP